MRNFVLDLQIIAPAVSSKSRNRRSGAHLRKTRHLLDKTAMNDIPVFPAVRSALHPNPRGPSEATILISSGICRNSRKGRSSVRSQGPFALSDEAVAICLCERAMWVR
jgi:hypothetical protein